MEEAFNKIIKHVFNNWSAMTLAVEHSMGGPNSKQIALDCLTEVENYCLHKANIEEEDLQDFLDDYMEEKFNVILEDDSTREIGAILVKFLQLLRTGDTEACEAEYQKLPTANSGWMESNRMQDNRQPQVSGHVDESESSSDDSEEDETETPMEDDGWTVVKTRRKC